jgi:signal transduction histidine kinase
MPSTVSGSGPIDIGATPTTGIRAAPETKPARWCHHQQVTAPARSTVGVAAILATIVVMLGAVFWLDLAIDRTDRPELFDTDAEVAPLFVTIASAAIVGAVLAVRRPRHPVGWLFLALAAAVVASGVLEGYALYGAVARPGGLPAAEAVTVFADGSFILWFALVMWILHLTPTGSPLSRRWRLLAVLSTVAMVLWFATSLVWPHPLDPPFETVRSPWALDGGTSDVLRVLRGGLGAVSGIGFVLGGVSLLVRFHRSRGDERRRLIWLAIAVVPLPVFVALAFYASPDHPVLLSVAIGGFMSLVPIAAGLSIARYHLYDVERILSRAVAYLLASAVLAVTFATVVVMAGRFFGDRGGGSSVPAVLGTLAAVLVAAPAYRGFQEAVDRRFDRRRYDAIAQVQDFAHEPEPDASVEQVLRRALRDPSLEVGYWVDDRAKWLLPDGGVLEPMADQIEVRRRDRPIARVRYDTAGVDRALAGAVCSEATPELESAMLRARISVQLAEVRESRSRIAAAHVSERRRLERNLHDGAQQRLLALGLELRAAQVNGDPDRLRATVGAAIDELQRAVVELRELASGLHPAVLEHGGLVAAAEDLAGRFPVRLSLEGVDRRFPREIEATAWFLACEGVTNAVKHADAGHIDLSITATNGRLVVDVSDDGHGGADPAGGGLRGLADRAEAVGGSLRVETGPGGTTVTGEFPCGW